MSSFSSGKKIGIAVGVLAALAVIGFSAVRYIESSTVKMIRSLVSDYSEINQTEVGDISYSLLKNKLELKDIKIQFDAADGAVRQTSIAKIEVNGLNRSLNKLMRDPAQGHSMVDVADSVIVHDYTITGTHPDLRNQEVKLSGKSENIKKVRMDGTLPARFSSGDRMTSEELSLALTYDIAYAESESADITFSIKGGPAEFTISVSGVSTQGYDKGTLQQGAIKGIRLHKGEEELASLGLLRIAELTLPPADVMRSLASAADVRQKGDKEMSEEEAFSVLRSIFLREKPFIASLEATDLQSRPGGVSLKSFTFKNPSTHPFRISVAMDELAVPASLSPWLADLSLLGLKQLDVSNTFDLSLPEDGGLLQASAALDVKKLFKGEVVLEGTLPKDGANLEERLGSFAVSLLKWVYTDEGFLPRAAAATQRVGGMSPQTTLQLFEQELRANIGNGSSTPTTEDVDKLMNFFRNPGTLRVTAKPERPMTFKELYSTGAASNVTLTVEPGPQTLEQGMEAALKSMGINASPAESDR